MHFFLYAPLSGRLQIRGARNQARGGFWIRPCSTGAAPTRNPFALVFKYITL